MKHFSILIIILLLYNESLVLLSKLELNNNKYLNPKESIDSVTKKLMISDGEVDPILLKNNKDEKSSRNKSVNNYKIIAADDKINKKIFNFNNKLRQAEKDLNIKLKNADEKNQQDSNIMLESKIKSDSPSILNQDNSIPVYKINGIDTVVSITSDKTYAEINEKVVFELSNGSFSSVLRKFSLAGSSDNLSAFKLTSNDIKIKDAEIMYNCLDNSISKSENIESYLCVIAIFDEVSVSDEKKIVQIQYEYISQNILRQKDQSGKKYNTLIWFYDNFRRLQPVENLNLEIILNNNDKLDSLNQTNLIIYPEKINITNIHNKVSFKWKIPDLKENAVQKVSLDIPLFNEKCKQLYDTKFEVSSFSFSQNLLWFAIIVIFIFMTAFIYTNEKEKNETLKLSEEVEILKTIQEQEKLRNSKKRGEMMGNLSHD